MAKITELQVPGATRENAILLVDTARKLGVRTSAIRVVSGDFYAPEKVVRESGAKFVDNKKPTAKKAATKKAATDKNKE